MKSLENMNYLELGRHYNDVAWRLDMNQRRGAFSSDEESYVKAVWKAMEEKRKETLDEGRAELGDNASLHECCVFLFGCAE